MEPTGAERSGAEGGESLHRRWGARGGRSLAAPRIQSAWKAVRTVIKKRHERLASNHKYLKIYEIPTY